MEHIEKQIEELEKKLNSPELNINNVDQDLPNDIYCTKCQEIFRERWKIKQEIGLLHSEFITT